MTANAPPTPYPPSLRAEATAVCETILFTATRHIRLLFAQDDDDHFWHRTGALANLLESHVARLRELLAEEAGRRVGAVGPARTFTDLTAGEVIALTLEVRRRGAESLPTETVMDFRYGVVDAGETPGVILLVTPETQWAVDYVEALRRRSAV